MQIQYAKTYKYKTNIKILRVERESSPEAKKIAKNKQICLQNLPKYGGQWTSLVLFISLFLLFGRFLNSIYKILVSFERFLSGLREPGGFKTQK